MRTQERLSTLNLKIANKGGSLYKTNHVDFIKPIILDKKH